MHLASKYFFGEQKLLESTTSTLDQAKMLRIKTIILSKFASRRSAADSEALWAKCKTAIGQKCKGLRRQQQLSFNC